MEYKGTYYLYELDETNGICQYFTNNKTEFYVVPSENDNGNYKLAVSRQLLYAQFGIFPKENDYDVFNIDVPMKFQNDNGDNKIDSATYDFLSNFIHNFHLLLKSFGQSIVMQNIDDKNRIINILKSDINASCNQYDKSFVSTEYKIQLIFDGKYLIQDNHGNTILSLNNHNNAKKFFHIISKMLDNVITQIMMMVGKH